MEVKPTVVNFSHPELLNLCSAGVLQTLCFSFCKVFMFQNDVDIFDIVYFLMAYQQFLMEVERGLGEADF